MKDSILKGTGNSRFLKSAIPEGTTWAEALAMLRAGTFPMDLNGINSAGFQQVGTPLNKANLLKDVNALTLGLTGDAVPDDMFNILAHAGDLHVWKKTVKNAADVPAGYTLGEVQNVTKYPITDVRSGGYTIVTKAYSSLSVDDAGNVSVDESSYVNFYDDASAVRGKFIQVYSDSDILFIPNDANISTDYKTVGSSVIHNHYTDKYQIVIGYPLTPAGTTTTYPVSTNRNAYQEGSDAKPAGYTLGDATSGVVLADSNGSPNFTITTGTSISVTDDGTVSLGGSVTTLSSVYVLAKIVSPLKTYASGKFCTITCTYSAQYASGKLLDGIWYIPSDADISVDNTNSGYPTNLSIVGAQPVTGYATIPANTTIEYLGCLGEKTRMQVVSYVGTGTYGKANPCSLTFDFPPKVVVFLEMSGPSYRASCIDDNYGNDLRIIILKELDETSKQYFGFGWYVSSFAKKSADERTVSWYNTYNQGSQGNSTGYTYYFLAIG